MGVSLCNVQVKKAFPMNVIKWQMHFWTFAFSSQRQVVRKLMFLWGFSTAHCHGQPSVLCVCQHRQVLIVHCDDSQNEARTSMTSSWPGWEKACFCILEEEKKWSNDYDPLLQVYQTRAKRKTESVGIYFLTCPKSHLPIPAGSWMLCCAWILKKSATVVEKQRVNFTKYGTPS